MKEILTSFATKEEARFRPLFWGFVFNDDKYISDDIADIIVFVPSSGDLFLIYHRDDVMAWFCRVFVPSSGDLFLILVLLNSSKRRMRENVFVPSSGDLFLIRI